ncbi:MAG: glycosyltransferase family 4 protein [Candidatus Bathyarchaeia archaeon]|jgi:glycosyltransferase involved in cell wall biosynthesis
MKLSFVNFGSDRCGGNRVLYEVVNGLITRGHDVSYLALADQNWFSLKTPITVCKSPQDLVSAIPESDVLVATWCATAPLVDQVKGQKGTPAYYCQHHEPIFFFRPEEQEFVAATYRLNLNLIANSPWLAGVLKEKYGRTSSLIVPGVDQTVFKPNAAVASAKHDADVEREKAFADYKDKLQAVVKPDDLPQLGKCAPFKVLAFASQTPFKGLFDTVLPALNHVYRLLGDAVEFHLFGALPHAPVGYPERFLQKIVMHNPKSDTELAELYGGADLVVSGSWAESSPLPHLEAMACGTPVVCTEYGTEHYGDALVRVPPRAPRLLGDTVFKVLANRELREKMRLLGLEDVKQFTWQNTVDGAERFFKELVGEA